MKSEHVKRNGGLVACADLAPARGDHAVGPVKSLSILGSPYRRTRSHNAPFVAQYLLKYGAKINTQ